MLAFYLFVVLPQLRNPEVKKDEGDFLAWACNITG
jgi:hypothetical protein